MSTTSLDPTAKTAAPARRRNTLLLAFAVGLAAASVVMAPQAWSVWNRNTFLDPDDALRTVEIRDFLAGQPWFDLVPHRLAPDHPFPMHWSRLVDAPLAALQRGFETVLPATQAERAMRLTAPVLAFCAALLALLRLTRRTVGPSGLLPAALLLAGAAEPMANFLPGHIHHHGIQAALLLLATAALVDRVQQGGRARSAALGGALAMLSLGIGLQNLPFVIGLVTVPALLWVMEGAERRRSLAAFAGGLLAAVPVFLLDVPPDSFLIGACDAFSAAHLVAATATAVVFFVLAGSTACLPGRAARLAAASAGAALVLGLVAVAYPQCLHDPMAQVDPLLREGWLSGVGEALPLGRLIALAWPQGVALLLTLLGGLAATVWATLASRPEDRTGWFVLLGLAAIGFVGSLWQVRVAASCCTLLVPGVAWLVLRVHDRAAGNPRAPALFLAFLAGVFGNGAGWNALALPLARHGSGPHADPTICFDPEALRDLAALPPGLVLSTIDPGSAILAYSAHSVLAAPYHRNSYGNRVSLLALAAPPEAAHALVSAAKVRYLALCRASNETAETVAQHPDSLSAALLADRVPAWLTPIGGRDATYLLYRVP